MSLGSRLTVVTAAVVALAIAVASAGIYVVVRAALTAQVDESLRRRAQEIAAQENEVLLLTPQGELAQRILRAPPLDASGTYAQLISAGGAVSPPPGLRPPFEPGAAALSVASGERGALFENIVVSGERVRLFTVQLQPGVAVQVARSLQELDTTLNRLGLILVLVCVAGVLVAAGFGRAMAGAALAPVRRLTETAEHVTDTSDLSLRISEEGEDELGRLAASFNRMLRALEASVLTQRRLVADASHELRTPLTSLRTNVEVLGRDTGLSERERKSLVDDVVLQLQELTLLVGDLVELARGNEPSLALEDVRLDLLVAEVVERARKRAPGLRFETQLAEVLVRGDRERLARAIGNLVDNAVKWSPPKGKISVSVDTEGRLSVRDHGPGLEDEDIAHLFDRFYRAPSARHMPGSGLGLAIVRHVAESHDGAVSAANAPGGGAIFTLELDPALQPASEA